MNLFAKKIIGIDFHDKLIELVELQLRKDSFELESFSRIAVPDGFIVNGEIKKPSELQSLLQSAINKANPKPIKTKTVAILLPSKDVFTHIFKFPSKLKEKEIRTIVAGEAENVIPFAIDDVYWDFSILEKEDGNRKRAYQYVLFAATPRVIADEYTKLLTNINLTPVLFNIYTDTLKHALTNQLDSKFTNLIVELGPYSTNYVVIKNNTIKNTISSSLGSEKLINTLQSSLKVDPNVLMDNKQQDQLTENSVKEIEKFLLKVYKQSRVVVQESENASGLGTIKNIYLTGEYSSLPNALELAKKAFPDKNVIIGDPKTGINVTDGNFKPADKTANVPYSVFFTNAIGVAKAALINGKRNGVNLLPDELKSLFKKKKIGLLLNILAVLMATACLISAALIFFVHQDISYSISSLEAQRSNVQKLLYGTRYQEIYSELTEFNNEVAVLNKIDNALFSVPTTLETIDEMVPKEISLTSLKFDDTELTVGLTGIADTREDLLEFQNSLRELSFVNDIASPISNYDKNSDISFHFEISLKFSELPLYGASTK